MHRNTNRKPVDLLTAAFAGSWWRRATYPQKRAAHAVAFAIQENRKRGRDESGALPFAPDREVDHISKREQTHALRVGLAIADGWTGWRRFT